MAIVLALGAAAFYGAGDFIGGLASRRNAVLAVALHRGAAATSLLCRQPAATITQIRSGRVSPAASRRSISRAAA